jgi:pilus assembly protein Flp/PilA
MNTLKQHVGNFLTNEDGATAIEYGLLAALISVVIITAATAVGTNLTAIFTTISTKLAAALPAV